MINDLGMQEGQLVPSDRTHKAEAARRADKPVSAFISSLGSRRLTAAAAELPLGCLSLRRGSSEGLVGDLKMA